MFGGVVYLKGVALTNKKMSMSMSISISLSISVNKSEIEREIKSISVLRYNMINF